jgi:DNA-binding beta-propeller fold protein YncE
MVVLVVLVLVPNLKSDCVYREVSNGQFAGPRAVAVDLSTGNVFVADTNNNRIQVFVLGP